MLVPDTQGTMNEFNVKMKDVEKFMSKQKLPRLVDTTPVLDENNVTVNTSKPLGRGGFRCRVQRDAQTLQHRALLSPSP